MRKKQGTDILEILQDIEKVEILLPNNSNVLSKNTPCEINHQENSNNFSLNLQTNSEGKMKGFNNQKIKKLFKLKKSKTQLLRSKRKPRRYFYIFIKGFLEQKQ